MPAKSPRNERVQLAWRLGRWVGSTLAAMLAPAREKEARPAEPAPPPAPSPELPAEEHRRLAPAEAGPPAHWVEKVRRAAPDLLLDLAEQRRRRPPPGFAYPPVGLPRSAPAPTPAPAPRTPTLHAPAPPAVEEPKGAYATPAVPAVPKDPPSPALLKDPLPQPQPALSKDPPSPALPKDPPPPALSKDPPPPPHPRPVAELPAEVSEDSYTPAETPPWTAAEAPAATEASKGSYSAPLAGALPPSSSPPPVSARAFVAEPPREPPVLHLPLPPPRAWPALGGKRDDELELDLDAPETAPGASPHPAPRVVRWMSLPERATAASEPSAAAPPLPPPWPELPETPATPPPHWSELYRALERRGRLDREQRGE